MYELKVFYIMHIISMLDGVTYKGSGPSVKVLLESDFIKEISIAFKSGHQMKSHKSGYPIVIHIVEGTIDLGVDNERFMLKQGVLVSLEANVLHDLIAVERSIVRLSVHVS